MQLPSPDWSRPEGYPFSPFQLTCSSAEEGISVRRISSPGRTSLAGTVLVTRSSESLCQESCYYRKLKYLLSDPASSLRNHPMYLRIHLSYITYQGSTSNRRIFRRRYRNTSLSHSYFHICLRFRVWNKSRPLRSLTSATTAWLPRESHLHCDYAKKAWFSTTVTQAFISSVSFPHNKKLYPALLRRYLKATRNLRPLFPSSKTFILMLY